MQHSILTYAPKAARLAMEWDVGELAEHAPISVIGTAANMNAAIDNGLERAARLLGMSA